MKLCVGSWVDDVTENSAYDRQDLAFAGKRTDCHIRWCRKCYACGCGNDLVEVREAVLSLGMETLHLAPTSCHLLEVDPLIGGPRCRREHHHCRG